MKTRIVNLWDRLRSTFWFVPAGMSVLAVALAILMPWLDAIADSALSVDSIWLSMSADSARAILSSIAGAMVTVAGVVFSITIVALTVASSQFGPRLLRTFMRDEPTHFAFGTFVSASIYSLVLLSSVRNVDAGRYVPVLSVTLAVLWAIFALGVLIYFVHRIAQLIQAPNIVRAVALDLDQSIERLFPGELGDSPAQEEAPEILSHYESLGDACGFAQSRIEGYLQAVDEEELLETAVEHDVVVKMFVGPGDFVARGSRLAAIWPEENASAELDDRLNGLLIAGNRPTPRQDVESAVNELVELAVRSLSPSLNDPFTACNCIDYLSSALGRLATRQMPSPFRIDQERRLRVIVCRLQFSDVLDTAFDQIRQYGGHSVVVLCRLVEAMRLIALCARRKKDRHALLRHALDVKATAERNIPEDSGRQAIITAYGRFREALNDPEEQAGHAAQ